MAQITIDQIRGELEAYEALMQGDQVLDTKDLDAMKEKGMLLVGYLARSATLVAVSKKFLNEAKVKAYHRLKASSEAAKDYYSPMLAKDYVSAQCSEAHYVADLADRVNAALTHAIEFIRSAMSAEKTQLAYLNQQV